MLNVDWNPVKNRRLKRTRGVSFDELLAAELIDIVSHPSRADTWIMLFKHKGYIWGVPFVRNERGIFLKTLYPNRKYTKIYNREGRL